MSTDLTRHDRPATDESSSLVFEAEIEYAPAPDSRERLRRIFLIVSRAKPDADNVTGADSNNPDMSLG